MTEHDIFIAFLPVWILCGLMFVGLMIAVFSGSFGFSLVVPFIGFPGLDLDKNKRVE